ncbi:MAG: portal protein, partial [Casimicrobium sp.]
MDENKALELARSAFSVSTTFFDASIRPAIEADMRQFQGLHPAGSKYNADAYKGRSRLFRPKTRTAVRKNEAVAAEAFFSTHDVVNVKAIDDADETSKLASDILQPILQHRLQFSIPWFLTCIGAYQEAQTNGVCISYQNWEYNEKRGIDRPMSKLVPVENFRIDPATDWADPVESSPYLIELIPMYVQDVQSRMKQVDPKTNEPKWKTYAENEIHAAVTSYSDSTRLLREGKRTDSKEQSHVGPYSIAWVHRNIMRLDDEDWVFYTLGRELILSKPKPLAEVYAHGRPYAIGICALEAHKIYPAGPVRMTKDVQAEINEIANQRLDNVKLAMNKRYWVARNRQVDLRALTRNIPGGVTMMNDIEKDVKQIDTPDVTGSSYQEQDRLNLDFDDMSGSFSNSSVQSNRRLNETVGGMNIITTNANQIAGYQLRTFVETWVEKVANQIVRMEMAYETDPGKISLSPEGRAFMQMGGNLDELFKRGVYVKVNVGMGATNPQDQVQNFMSGMTAVRDLLQDNTLESRGLKAQEVMKEVFGKLGYSDGSRFFQQPDENVDPQVATLQNKITALQQALDAKHPPELVQAQINKITAEIDALNADTVDKKVKGIYSAIQAGQVIAAVPDVSPVADSVLQSAGFKPDAEGVDPNLPQPAQSVDPSVIVGDVKNKRTGVGFSQGGDT